MKGIIISLLALSLSNICFAQPVAVLGVPASLTAQETVLLNAKFNNVHVFDLDITQLETTLNNLGNCNVHLDDALGFQRDFNLERNNLLSGSAQLIHNDGLTEQQFTGYQEKTFEGETPQGEKVRFSVLPDGAYGIFISQGDYIIIEPIQKIVPDISKNMYVCYRKSWLKTLAETGRCLVQNKPGSPVSYIPTTTATTCRYLELALELDYDFFINEGGISDSYDRILYELNIAEAIYESALDIHFIVNYL